MDMKNSVIKILIGLVLILCAVIGYKSVILKRLAMKLLKLKHDNELKDLYSKREQLKKEMKDVEIERIQKTKLLYDALNRIKRAGGK